MTRIHIMDKSDEVWSLIKANEGYFRKVHRDRAESAMLDTWWHVVYHRDRAVPISELLSYIKKTCCTIYKTRSEEIPVSLYDDERGEVSQTFVKSVTSKVCEERYEESEDVKALLNIFTGFYLNNSAKFEQVYSALAANGKVHLDKNDKWVSEFSKLFRQYPTNMILEAMGVFKAQIVKNELKSRIGKRTKAINIQPFDQAVIMQINDVDIYQGDKVSRLNISTLRMQPEIDLDRKHWSLGCSNKGIVRICIDKYMDDIINNILVEEGKTTHYIKWFNEHYIMVSPSGHKSSINETRENFIEYCRKELICNIVRELDVIAVSESYVYVLPNRKLSFKTMELVGEHRTIVLELEDVPNENL